MRHRAKVLTIVATTTALLVSGAVPGRAAPPVTSEDHPLVAPATAPAAASYDGQTIFVGLLLGLGPLAERYPDLVAGRTSGTEDPQQLAEFGQLVTSAVEKVQPDFFDTFGPAVTSGDRVQVDRALQSASEVLMIALTEEMDGTVGESPQLGVALILLVAVIAVAHVTFGAVVNVAVVANVAWALDQPAGSTARIDQEKWADQVAEALATE